MSSSNIGSTSRSTYDSVMSGLGKIGSAIYHAPGELGRLFFGVPVKPVTGIRNLMGKMGKMGEMFFSYESKRDSQLNKTPSSLSLFPTTPTSEEIEAAKESLASEGNLLPTDPEIDKKIIEARINTLTDYRTLLRKINRSLDSVNQTTLNSLEQRLKSLQNNNSRESENVTNTPSTSEQPVNQSNNTQEIEEETNKPFSSQEEIDEFTKPFYQPMPTPEEKQAATNELNKIGIIGILEFPEELNEKCLQTRIETLEKLENIFQKTGKSLNSKDQKTLNNSRLMLDSLLRKKVECLRKKVDTLKNAKMIVQNNNQSFEPTKQKTLNDSIKTLESLYQQLIINTEQRIKEQNRKLGNLDKNKDNLEKYLNKWNFALDELRSDEDFTQ